MQNQNFNVKKFISDLINGAEACENIDPMEFGTVLISALVNQLGEGGAQIAQSLTRGQKAARTRKRNAARNATATNSGAGAGSATQGA